MDDRVPIEAKEELPEASDLLETRRKAIRKEAGIAILLGGVIVLLHLIFLCLGVLELRDISGSLIFIILLIIGFAVILEGVWGLRRARNLTLENLKPGEQETDFDKSLKRTKPDGYVLLGLGRLIEFVASRYHLGLTFYCQRFAEASSVCSFFPTLRPPARQAV